MAILLGLLFYGLPMPKYDQLTHRFAEWLFQYIDRYDWGYRNKQTGSVPYTSQEWQLLGFYNKVAGVYPQKLTRTTIQSHLNGKGEQLHYTPSRSSGFCLVMVDVDAHQNESDAFEAVCWIRDRYFGESYLEASGRGYHLYFLVRVGACPRVRFNSMLSHMATALTILLDQGFQAKVEVKPSFTIVHHEALDRGMLAPMPLLPHGASDIAQLERMGVYLPSAMRKVCEDGNLTKELADELFSGNEEEKKDTHTSGSIEPLSGQRPIHRNSNCAWQRMKYACFDYTVVHKALPDEEQLLAFYKDMYQTDEGTHHRRRRAKTAIKLRKKTFDPYLISEGGYTLAKEQLFSSIILHCQDRSNRHNIDINDEDLTIGLYVVMRNSFCVSDNPRLQWTCGYDAFRSMAQKLKEEGVTQRLFGNRNKISAVKEILERSGLIECIDRKYIAAGKDGVSMKYHIGPDHWRYTDFIKFSQDVQVLYVGTKRVKAEVHDDQWAMVA